MGKSYKVNYRITEFVDRQDIFDDLPDGTEETIINAIAKMFCGCWGFCRESITVDKITAGHYETRTRPGFPFATYKTFIAD